MASTSTLVAHNQWKYDVFLSFRGADTRSGFVSHLYDALCRNQIEAFIDYELAGGDEISPVLLKTIEESCVSVVIFSKNYADSPWCLDELEKIVESKEVRGQMVLPVFYNVEPSDVQELRGSFADAFVKHREELNGCLSKVESWSHAVKEVSFLKGLDSNIFKTESKLIEEIVNDILDKLNHLLASDFDNDGFVGLDARIKEIDNLLCIGSLDVSFVGIWGMGGVGKTTLAGAVFNKFFSRFQGQCFFASVREELEKRTLVRVRDEILSQVLEEEDLYIGTPDMLPSYIKKRLRRKKVLIVLDDVNSSQHLKTLVGEHSLYGPGSRIIVTSRDRQVLKNLCDKIYGVKRLMYREALSLFRLHAFKQNQPTEEHMDLSRKMVNYTKGNPLALKVLGCNLYDKGIKEWENELAKLEGHSDMEVQRVLKVSYDGLDWNEQCIFLDIACFLKGMERDRAETLLDGCGFFARSGITYLYDKSLITISKNKLGMHDLLQKMGQTIVRQECIRKPWRRSRLWTPNDTSHVLTKDMGTDMTEVICLDASVTEGIKLSPTVFSRMDNLRFLQFYNSTEKINVSLPKGLESLPDELRLLYWDQYPLKSLPSQFCPNNLVELHMPHSQVKQLWNGIPRLENLTCVNLSYSTNLVRIPDFFEVPNLQFLYLDGCTSLVEIPSSIQYHSKLNILCVNQCKNLCIFPSCFHLTSLEGLFLDGCSKVTQFLEPPQNVKALTSEGTRTVEQAQNLADTNSECHPQYHIKFLWIGDCDNLRIIPSLRHLENLEILSLDGSSLLAEFPDIPVNIKRLYLSDIGIEQVPSSIGHLSQLELLDLNSCNMIENLPISIGELKSIKIVTLHECKKLKCLPDSICNLKSLEVLEVARCINLHSLPEDLGNLESLERLSIGGSGIKSLPSSIDHLSKLRTLFCGGCRGLILPSFSGLWSLERLFLQNCDLLELPDSLSSLISLKVLVLEENNFETLPASIKQLSNLSTLYLKNCKKVQFLPKLPPSLENFDARNCTSMRSLKHVYVEDRRVDQELFDFGNCFSLDQNARAEIMTAAQLKFECMNSVVQKCNEEVSDEEQEYSDAEEESLAEEKNILDPASLGACFCIPGSEIPPWFLYQSSGSTLAIPEIDRSDDVHLGCAFCAVVACNGLYDSRGFDIRCDGYFARDTGYHHYLDCSYLSSRLMEDQESAPTFLQSEHVFIWSEFYESNLGLSRASFEFYPVDWNKSRIYSCEVIKCGVSLIFVGDRNGPNRHAEVENVENTANSCRPLSSDQDSCLISDSMQEEYDAQINSSSIHEHAYKKETGSTTCWNWLTFRWLNCF